MEIRDILGLLGNELKDSNEKPKIFRKFIEQEKWDTEQIEKWLNDCINNNSDDKIFKRTCNFAFQDLVISLGKRLGFEIDTVDILENQMEIIMMGFGEEIMVIC